MLDNNIVKRIKLGNKRMSMVVGILGSITSIPLFFLMPCSDLIWAMSVIIWLSTLNIIILLAPWIVNKIWKNG